MLIDCDANATYLPDEELRGVISQFLGRCGNPSSLHRHGQRARAALEDARAVMRNFVGARPNDQIVFTSGASEANNTVVAACGAAPNAQLVASAVEHPCVLEPLRRLSALGREVSLVLPDRGGRIDAHSVSARLSPKCALVSIMAANNETGVLNPVAEIARAARDAAPEALIHTDAAQLPGKTEISFSDLGVDCMTISGHKFGAPSGIGAIVVRDGVHLEPFILGGPQEGKLRGGTENVLGACAMAAAAQAVAASFAERVRRMRTLRDHFEKIVGELVPGCDVNGLWHERLPNTSSLFVPGVRADDLVVALDLEGILVSAGAACSSGKPGPSHVLQAMGQSDERVSSTVRISFRGDSELNVATRVAQAVARASERMRRQA